MTAGAKGQKSVETQVDQTSINVPPAIEQLTSLRKAGRVQVSETAQLALSRLGSQDLAQASGSDTQERRLGISTIPEQGRGPRPGRLHLAVAWRGMGDKLLQQRPRTGGHLGHGALKGRLIGFGRHVEATELAHELQRGIAYLQLGGGWLEVEQGLDVATHGTLLGHLAVPSRARVAKASVLLLKDSVMKIKWIY